MQWLKVALACAAGLVVLSVASVVLKLVQGLLVVLLLVAIVGTGLSVRNRLRTAQNAKIDARRSKEEQARALQVRERIEAELERMKRERP